LAISKEIVMLDLVVRRARLPGTGGRRVDIGIRDGRIATVAPLLPGGFPELDADDRLVIPGLVDTHLHLDKSRTADRCTQAEGTLDEAIRETARIKAGFTEEDVYRRARETLECCVLHGTTRVRTHVEVDPAIGLRGLHAVQRLATELEWAVDVQVCVFAQEGLTGSPETDALLVAALEEGVPVVGGAPYADANPAGQLDRVFELAGRFDVDVDLHLDLAETTDGMQLAEVCERTVAHGWEGRVTVGHVTQLSLVPPEEYASLCELVAASGVAVTVLPATDLFLMGRAAQSGKPRGVVPLAPLQVRDAACSVATNNVLNAFTPYGDGSLIRMANLYANVTHAGSRSQLRDCLDLVTNRAARVLRIQDYGIRPGLPADVVCVDAIDEADAVARLAPVLWALKGGRRTFTRAQPVLDRPSHPVPDRDGVAT
jgi:cytosine/creatinine deaminase